MKVLVTGGCGYIGAMLVPWLLADGHKVTVLDTMWFGDGGLPQDNGSLRVHKGDVRDRGTAEALCKGQEAVIYLASLSNNDLCERLPAMALDVNQFGLVTTARAAVEAGVERFIYASSVAAYGSSDTDAIEVIALAPSTPYGRGKDYCERVLETFQSPEFTTIITRSASVCGYSLHQRLDLTVNMMVHDAVRRGVITVNGGEQKRCHVHMRDIVDFYRLLLKAPKDVVAGQTFNVVAENESVLQTAERIAKECHATVEIRPRSDNRSYTVDGTKARRLLGFEPLRSVMDAVYELKWRLEAGYFKDSMTNPIYHNLVETLA